MSKVLGKVDNGTRTDLAVEFVQGCSSKSISSDIKRTDVSVDAALSKKLNKPVGTYITVESNSVKEGKRFVYKKISEELSHAISSLVKGKSCLIVGLGNPNMTADSLGKLVANRLMITRHIATKEELPILSCICPNVLGVTGIESFDIVKGVADRTHPDSVIVIDSLAGATTARIASAFQVSSAGITPGSGVSNHRVRLDKSSLGCPVISVGVPLVVYASTIIADAVGDKFYPEDYDSDIASLIVTPKDIDLYVADCAEIVADSINTCFFGSDFSI